MNGSGQVEAVVVPRPVVDGKRWLAVWTEPNDDERSKAFATKPEATRYGARMETDRVRGDYLDPNAAKVRLDELGPRWLGSRSVDPATMVTYEGRRTPVPARPSRSG